MKEIQLKNPIIHIILFGFLLAIVLLIVLGPPKSEGDNRRVVISNTDVAQVRGAWMRTWQREPTFEELRGQLQQYVREEVLYREALKREYDRDDQIVKRSLVRKMDFLAEGQVQAKNISDEEVRSYYALRRERYRVPEKVSFAHIYFSVDKRGENADQDITETIRLLSNRDINLSNISQYGDQFMLQNHYAEYSQQEIQNLFGEEFARQVFQLDTAKWQGPVYSGYGAHAVYIFNRIESDIPELTEVRTNIVMDMMFEEKQAAREQFYTEILRQYQIVYEGFAEELLSGGEE